MSLAQELISRIRRVAPQSKVLESPAQMAGYDTDGIGYKSFPPDAVVIPADAGELQAIIPELHGAGVPVCMRGAGTSLAGGPVAAQGGVIVHTSRLKAIREIQSEGFWCEVECGVNLSRLDEALRPFGLCYPPDPSSGPVCTIGGNVASNAGGASCFRYGVTGNYVLGLEVVMRDGSVRQFGGPCGGRGPWREDWKRLMVGSEGTLGAFTRFWLRLTPRAEKTWTFRATYPCLQSTERAIHALVRHPAYPTAIELMDPRAVEMVERSPMAAGLPLEHFLLVVEIDGPAALVDHRARTIAATLRNAGSVNVASGDDPEERESLLKARKAIGGILGQASADFLVQDAVIPKRALAEILGLIHTDAERAGIPVVTVMHAGDGNLHPNFLFDSRQPREVEKIEAISKHLMERVLAVGGTLSGEHGIGNDKTAYMGAVFGPESSRMQLGVPGAFDPLCQWNPLKVFSERRFAA